MQHDSRRRLGDRNNRPRYTDNGDYSSKNEGVSSLPTARGRNERASTGYTRPPPTTSRALQPQISLTNLFEDTQHTQAQYPKSGKKTQDKSTGKGRIRSISDTSIYSRTENINFDNTAATKTKKVNINEDEVKLIEDQNDTRQVLTAANNGRQDGSENEIGDKTISLTEFAKLEEIVPVKQ